MQSSQVSARALPKHSLLQSRSLLARCPVLPSEQTSQVSMTAVPKQSPLQSMSELAW